MEDTVLMEGAGLLPILKVEGCKYTVDLAKRQFRPLETPWVVYRFESCIGRQLMHALHEAGMEMAV